MGHLQNIQSFETSIETGNLQQSICFRVTSTTFWLKCKNLPKYTKFCSTRKLEVAAKNFGLLTKNRLMHWQIQGLKGSMTGNFCAVCLNF